MVPLFGTPPPVVIFRFVGAAALLRPVLRAVAACRRFFCPLPSLSPFSPRDTAFSVADSESFKNEIALQCRR